MELNGYELICKNCHARFTICTFCYRGQVYCQDSCRITSQLQIKKKAQEIYSKTKKGKQSNSIRQDRYRKKKKEKNTPILKDSNKDPNKDIKNLEQNNGSGLKIDEHITHITTDNMILLDQKDNTVSEKSTLKETNSDNKKKVTDDTSQIDLHGVKPENIFSNGQQIIKIPIKLGNFCCKCNKLIKIFIKHEKGH